MTTGMTTEPILSEAMAADVDELCVAFRNALMNLGADGPLVRPAEAGQCRYSTATDPYDGAERLIGEWVDGNGFRYAHFVRYGDGRMFAEHDVLQPHPDGSGQFVEAVEIWGSAGALKHEARLLPSL